VFSAGTKIVVSKKTLKIESLVLGNFFLLGGAGECWVRGHIPDNSGKEEV
jgi:hypothetical protein